METLTTKAAEIGAAEYLKAKLAFEATPVGLQTTLETSPKEVYVLDVRERDAWEMEHIPGAANVPLAELTASLSTLPKDRTIVTYCWDMTCALAPQAALDLAQKGFRVQFLAGGIEEWKRKELPVERAG